MRWFGVSYVCIRQPEYPLIASNGIVNFIPNVGIGWASKINFFLILNAVFQFKNFCHFRHFSLKARQIFAATDVVLFYLLRFDVLALGSASAKVLSNTLHFLESYKKLQACHVVIFHPNRAVVMNLALGAMLGRISFREVSKLCIHRTLKQFQNLTTLAAASFDQRTEFWEVLRSNSFHRTVAWEDFKA